MLEVLLVLLACTQGKGCSQTTNAYYSDHPEVKRLIKEQEQQVKRIVGPEAVAVSPAFILMVRGKGSVHITGPFNLEIPDRDTMLITFKLGF